MEYLLPMKIQTTFKVEISGSNIQPFIDVCSFGLFESFNIDYMRKTQSCISVCLSTTVQTVKPRNITFEYIERTERRFRNDFLKRISLFNSVVLCIKEKTEISFVSKAYPLSKKSVKQHKK